MFNFMMVYLLPSLGMFALATCVIYPLAAREYGAWEPKQLWHNIVEDANNNTF